MNRLLLFSVLLLLAAVFPAMAPAQVITQVIITPGFGGVLVTVSHSGVPSNYWIGVSVRRPDGKVDDLPPAQAGRTGGTAFNYWGPDCKKYRGYQFAAAIWKGYNGREMVGLVHRFRRTTWVPMGCPATLAP